MTELNTKDNLETTATPLPLAKLLILSVAGFLTMLTETIPAGLLPGIQEGLTVSASTAGQLLTAYAAAATAAAIPLVAITTRFDRKIVIIGTIFGIAVANTICAIAPIYSVAFIARVAGGALAALQWAILAGFAMRLASPTQQGRALAISMAGIPTALALGVPLGTALGDIFDWRIVFGIIAAVGVLVSVAAQTLLPTKRAEEANKDGAGKSSFAQALALPGLAVVLICACAFQFGHMNLYTYIAPVIAQKDGSTPVSVVLLVLGIAAMAGLFSTGAIIDKRLPVVGFASMAAFAIGIFALSFTHFDALILMGAALWGFGLGCAPTVYQTASARIAGPLVDRAQALLVTVFNLGMAAGSAVGGLALAQLGENSLAPISIIIFVAIIVVLALTRRTAMPGAPADLA